MNFCDKYKIILFDMDGVITSEYRYWDCAAFTIYRAVTKKDGTKNPKEVFDTVFFGKKTLDLLKKAGVNSNWDLTYVIVSVAKILKTDDFEKVYKYLKELGLNAIELYRHLEKDNPVGTRSGEGYEKLKDIFQYYYWGDAMYEKMWGKCAELSGWDGFYTAEEPVIALDKIRATLKALNESGITLGIGTGRVYDEAVTVLRHWDILKYFDETRVITYTDVQKGEKVSGGVALTKPHPYMFLKGMAGCTTSDTDILSGNFDKEMLSKTLVVGDAGADILSAKAGGMDFAAVLTGVAGKAHREFFEKSGADYILDDMSFLI